MKTIGERIRRKRELLNIRLTDLAKKVGVSPSALSQIEKAKAVPSVSTLQAIAKYLCTTVSDLIGENESLNSNPLVRGKDLKLIHKNDSGTEIYLLSHPNKYKQMKTYFIRFTNGSDLSGLFTESYGQIFCYVISGKIQFSLEDKNYVLNKGDSFYFTNKVPYIIKNNNGKSSEFLWITSE